MNLHSIISKQFSSTLQLHPKMPVNSILYYTTHRKLVSDNLAPNQGRYVVSLSLSFS